MDNKITKQRFSDQMEYDWFKYILIIIACIVFWIFVFGQINANKDYEEINVFVTAYDKFEQPFETDVLTDMRAQGDDLIRQFYMEVQSPLSKDYGSLLQTRGFVTSDILVLGKYQMENMGAVGLELNDDVLAKCIPDGYEPQFFEMGEEGHKVKRGIRVDKEALANVGRIFSFNPLKEGESMPDEIPEGEEYKYETEFYMIINPSSANIGKYMKKPNEQREQTFKVVKKFIESYR